MVADPPLPQLESSADPLSTTGPVTPKNVDYLIQTGQLEVEYVVLEKRERKRAFGIRLLEVIRFFINYLYILDLFDLSGDQIINGDEVGIGGPKDAQRAQPKGFVPATWRDARRTAFFVLNGAMPNATIMFWTTASGYVPKPWLLLKQNSSQGRLSKAIAKCGMFPIYRVPRAYMNMDVFQSHLIEMVQHYREDWLTQMGLKHAATTPILIILDGAPSHSGTAEFFQDCRDANIHLLLLPANATHVFQPVDVGYARALKKGITGKINNAVDDFGDPTGKATNGLAEVLEQYETNLYGVRPTKFGQGVWRGSGMYPLKFDKLDSRQALDAEVRQVFADVAMLPRMAQMAALEAKMDAILAENNDTPGFDTRGGTFLTGKPKLPGIVRRRRRVLASDSEEE